MAIEALKESSIIIFISGLNLHKTPEVVQEAIASDEANGPTPIIAVFDAKVEKRLGVVPYYDMKDPKGFAAVQSALSDELGVAVKASKMADLKPENWKDKRGRTIRATYVNSTEKEVTFRLTSGNMSTVELSKMSDESRTRIAELAAE